jgi:hypothetical protein
MTPGDPEVLWTSGISRKWTFFAAACLGTQSALVPLMPWEL